MQIFNQIGHFLRKIEFSFKFFKIGFSFVFIFVLAYFLDEMRLYFFFVIFVCLHELAHFFVAKKLGYMATKIHLTFFGASLEGLDDFTLNDEIKIVVVGPLFNLFVVVLCYLSFWFFPESYIYLNDVLIANLSIFLFNILPIYPLDCGRLILSFLSKKMNRKRALNLTKKISLFVIVFLFLLFLISFFFEFNFTLGFVCVNLAFLLFSSAKDTSFKRSLFAERKFKLISKGLLERNIYVSSKTSLYSLFKFIDDNHFYNFIFLDENYDIVNTLSEIEFYQAMKLL